MSGRESLTVVIPTRNAAALLADCLESVAWADELIVVDMFSTDDTGAVCARYPQCRLVQRDDYIFGNVNFGFDEATSDWVMRLDTDERITPELAQEIGTILSDPPPDVVGYLFRQRMIILGRELRHGAGSDHYRQMMFRHGTARYPVRSEHEALETTGTWLRARNAYVHHNYSSVRQYMTKARYYTDKDVERAELPKRRPTIAKALFETARAEYLYVVKKQGFRDGWRGILDGTMRAVYQFLFWTKLRRRWTEANA